MPPQGKQLGLKVDFAALNEANNGPEVPTRVSDAVFAARDIVVIELQDIDHSGRSTDGADVLDGLSPGAWVSPQEGAKEAPCRNNIDSISDRVSIIGDSGTRFDDQRC
jgi:hypothetical protein